MITELVAEESLNDLDITPSQFEKLTEAEINTVCELETAIAEGKIQYVKGIGPNAVDRITDALMAWREKNPIPVAEENQDDESEEEDSTDGETTDENNTTEPETEESTEAE